MRQHSEFQTIHQKLKKILHPPNFPSKRNHNLRTKSLEQRRLDLENYLQVNYMHHTLKHNIKWACISITIFFLLAGSPVSDWSSSSRVARFPAGETLQFSKQDLQFSVRTAPTSKQSHNCSQMFYYESYVHLKLFIKTNLQWVMFFFF